MSRFWEVIDKHKVNIFYTAPTALRALMGAGDEPRDRSPRARACACWARSASRSIPKPGSGITTSSANGKVPIVDTWWQTETGGILITPLPGATDLKPGSATRPFFGVQPQLVDDEGEVLERCRRRQSLHHRFLAGPDAHRLWRP